MVATDVASHPWHGVNDLPMLLRINQALHNQRCTIHSEAVRLQPHMLLNRGNAGEAVTRPQPFHKACATPMGWLGPTSVPNLNPSCDGAPPDLDYLADNVPYVSLKPSAEVGQPEGAPLTAQEGRSEL